MPVISNPLKQSRFIVDLDGVPQFEIQEFQPPETTIEVAEHGEANTMVETPTAIRTGDATLTVIEQAGSGTSNAFYEWLTQTINPETLEGGLPRDYLRTFTVRALDADNQSTAKTWVLEGTFPKGIAPSAFNRTSTDNATMDITLSVERCYLV